MNLLKSIHKILEAFLIGIAALQAVLLMSNVLFRYALDSPIVWGDEIVRYSLIWMTFVGTALAVKERQHIQVDVIDLVLPKTGQKIVNLFGDAVVIAFMGFMIYYGIRMTDFQRGMFGETLAWFSYAYVYVSIPIGGFLTIGYTLSKYFIREDAKIQSDHPSEQIIESDHPSLQ